MAMAFEFDLPTQIPTNTPITVRYRLKFDGSDEHRWLVNITDIDGVSNPETLNDGEIFEVPTDESGLGVFQGDIELTVEREGPFRLKAVNPDQLSQGYATSLPGFAVDVEEGDPGEEDPDGGTGTGTGGGTGTGTGDGTGTGTGTDDGDGDGDGTGNGTGSETDPDDPDGEGDDESIPGGSAGTSQPSSVRPTGAPRPTSSTGASPQGAASKKPNTSLIAGCIAAGTAVLLIIIALFFWFKSRREPGDGKRRRPLTFYKDRMIRAPTPPNEVSDSGHSAPDVGGYGYGAANAAVGYGGVETQDVRGAAPGADLFTRQLKPLPIPGILLRNPHDEASHSQHHGQQQPMSASTGIAPQGGPVMREFMLRSPRLPSPKHIVSPSGNSPSSFTGHAFSSATSPRNGITPSYATPRIFSPSGSPAPNGGMREFILSPNNAGRTVPHGPRLHGVERQMTRRESLAYSKA